MSPGSIQKNTARPNDPITRFVDTANEAIRTVAVPIAKFAFCAAIPTLLFCLTQKRFRTDAAQMLKREFRPLVNQAGLRNFLRVGAVAALVRGGIETYDFSRKNHDDNNLEGSLQKVLWSFFLGGLCGSLRGQIPTLHFKNSFLNHVGSKALPLIAIYHFGILDLFGEFAQRQLVNIREKKGDQKGLALSAAWILGINAVGIFMVRPFKKNWGDALISAGMILFFDTLLEAYVQGEGGRASWRDLDTGRLVGANLWGYMGLFLPSVILSSRKRAGGFFGTAVTVLELCLKNFFFVAPSLNNFNARLNDQNWNNAQLGHEVRHGTMMWLSQVGQVVFTPSSPLGIISDYTTSIGGSALVNERLPFYEGVEEIWRKGFLERIRKIGSAQSEEERTLAEEALTHYLCHEMGHKTLLGDQHLPSSLNLEKAKQLLRRLEDKELERLFECYLNSRAFTS